MNKQPCKTCTHCPLNKVLAAAKRICCLNYRHRTFDELEGDANIVAVELLRKNKERCNEDPTHV